MSRKTNRAAAEREDAEARVLLAEQEARFEARAELDRLYRQQLLAAARQELARDRREAEAADLGVYREQAIAAAVSSKTLAPQVGAMIPVGLNSREDVDAAVQLGIDKTAEILAEISGQQQGELPVQSRDEQTGRFLPQQQSPDQIVIDKSLSMQDYVEKVRPAMNIGNRDAGIFG